MINIEHVPIDIDMPTDRVKVVAMQPYLQLTNAEPFRWERRMIVAQIDAIERTLDLAQSNSANFTLFPEYSIPGYDGVSVIDQRISAAEWPNQSIIIAGVHGLNKGEYLQLINSYAVEVSDNNDPHSIPSDKWVNCCLIWVKDRNGNIKRWVQPKIRSAWQEMDVPCNDMFCGSTVYIYECKYLNGCPCKFMVFVCFDWVATIPGGTTVQEEVLRQLNDHWRENPQPLHWVFVIQHNQKPNHYSFLNSTRRFLSEVNGFPFVNRKEAIVLNINTATSAIPSVAKEDCFAFSSCVFSPNVSLDCKGCRPTVCMQPEILRGNGVLGRCKDVVFREMGECIHLFSIRVPCFVEPDATDRTYPIMDAQVYPAGKITDPRLCGGPVPAAVKWINDALDSIPHLSQIAFDLRPLKPEAEAAESNIIPKIRNLEGNNAIACINWATCSLLPNGDKPKADNRHTDLWDRTELEALEHVVHSLVSLGLAFDLEVSNTSLHCILNIEPSSIRVVAIRGDTYENCRRHYDKNVPKQETDPVLVIVRDKNNLKPTPEEYSKITEVGCGRGLRFLDYQTLISCCREARDKNEIRRCIDGYLPSERPII